VDALGDLRKDVNPDCREKGLQVLSVDSSQVALVSLPLREAASSEFKCGRPTSLGMNADSLAKILKMCGPSDSLKLWWRGGADTVSFQCESGEKGRIADFVLKLMQVVSEHSFQRESGEEGRFADFKLKLMHVVSEHMGIPEQPYRAQDGTHSSMGAGQGNCSPTVHCASCAACTANGWRTWRPQAGVCACCLGGGEGTRPARRGFCG